MPNIQAALTNPGFWLAVAAVILSMGAKPLARKLRPDSEDGQAKLVLWMKTGALAFAVAGFILVAKSFLFV